jgi:hypothetical protein
VIAIERDHLTLTSPTTPELATTTEAAAALATV